MMHGQPSVKFVIILLRMINASDIICRKLQTHFMFSSFVFSENRAFFKIMWKNMVHPDRPRMIVYV